MPHYRRCRCCGEMVALFSAGSYARCRCGMTVVIHAEGEDVREDLARLDDDGNPHHNEETARVQ